MKKNATDSAPDLVRVRFVREARPKDRSGDVFKVDSVHALSEASANHWKIRGYAVDEPIEPPVEQSVEIPAEKPKAVVP